MQEKIRLRMLYAFQNYYAAWYTPNMEYSTADYRMFVVVLNAAIIGI